MCGDFKANCIASKWIANLYNYFRSNNKNAFNEFLKRWKAFDENISIRRKQMYFHIFCIPCNYTHSNWIHNETVSKHIELYWLNMCIVHYRNRNGGKQKEKNKTQFVDNPVQTTTKKRQRVKFALIQQQPKQTSRLSLFFIISILTQFTREIKSN